MYINDIHIKAYTFACSTMSDTFFYKLDKINFYLGNTLKEQQLPWNARLQVIDWCPKISHTSQTKIVVAIKAPPYFYP